MIKANRKKIGYLLSKVPDEFQIRCAARGDRISSDQWDIGRDANMLWAIAVKDDWGVWRYDIYEVIAALHNYAIVARTVRHYSEIVSFYDDEERQDAHDKYYVLPFSHFALARTYGDLWEDILDASLKRIPDNNGLPPSADWLKAHFRGVSQAQEVLAIDNSTQDLDDFRNVADIDFDDLPNIADVSTDDEESIGKLSSQEHAMAQGIVRSLRFLAWVSEKMSNRGVCAYRFTVAVDELKIAATELMTELTTE